MRTCAIAVLVPAACHAKIIGSLEGDRYDWVRNKRIGKADEYIYGQDTAGRVLVGRKGAASSPGSSPWAGAAQVCLAGTPITAISPTKIAIFCVRRALHLSMRLGVLALLFASGCSLVQSLPSSNTPKHQRDAFYAVMGTFVVMATAAALIAGAPSEQPTMPRPSQELPPLGR